MNRQILLAARPEGFPKDSDFELVETEIPKPRPGEVLPLQTDCVGEPFPDEPPRRYQ